MKRSAFLIVSTLLSAASLGISPEARAGDAILLPAQQNNCANTQIKAKNGPPANERQTELKKGAPEQRKQDKSNKDHPIDLVICLDTSNSMDGLIDSAKQKIWDIVNEFATAKPRPYLRVGLYAYGSPSFGYESGYVHKVLDLSDDLDKAFTELSALRTNGGDEYCARVISSATQSQPWSDNKKALKIIVVAGNEAATQDPKLNVFDAAKTAVGKGIIVNMIFCGSSANSQSADWRKVASSADGQFAAIDQNNGTVIVSTPFDQKLAELSGSVNSTYLAYGKGGAYGKQMQAQADHLSLQMGASNFASRAAAKVSGQYRNSGWDLVDARAEKDFKLSSVKKAELPTEMQGMTSEEQQKYLDKKAAERTQIQKQIADLNVQRSKYIQAEMKKQGASNDKAFDAAMLKALRQQAEKNGFSFGTTP